MQQLVKLHLFTHGTGTHRTHRVRAGSVDDDYPDRDRPHLLQAQGRLLLNRLGALHCVPARTAASLRLRDPPERHLALALARSRFAASARVVHLLRARLLCATRRPFAVRQRLGRTSQAGVLVSPAQSHLVVLLGHCG